MPLLNACYDEYGFQPIMAFGCGGRMVAALRGLVCQPGGRQIVFSLRRLTGC
jgi:hypothetical protein